MSCPHLSTNSISNKSCDLHPFCLIALTFLLLLLSLSPLSVPTSHAAQIQLTWDPSPEPDIAGYRLYYGLASGDYSHVSDVGPLTSCVIAGLQENRVYFFAATAYTTSGLESAFSNELSYAIPRKRADSGGGGGGGGGGGCFIATAVYRSDGAPEVQALRHFRDTYLVRSRVGRAFIRSYYGISPTVANCIRKNETLRIITKCTLTPLVFGARYPNILAFLTLGCTIASLIFIRAFRKAKRDE